MSFIADLSRFEQAPRALSNLDRLGVLQDHALADSGREPAFDRLTRLASHLLGTPVALITLVDENRQIFKGFEGLGEPWATLGETPLTHSFCQYTLSHSEPLVVVDAREHPVLHTNLAVRDMGVVAYAGFPLTLQTGHTLGAFCAIDTVPRAWSEADLEILRELSQMALDEMELKIALKRQTTLVREREALLQLAAHELKNPLAVVMSMTDFLLEHPVDAPLGPDERDLLEHIGSAGRRMFELLVRILDAGQLEHGGLHLKMQQMDLQALVKRVVSELRLSSTRHSLELEPLNREPLELESSSEILVEGDAVRLEQVLRNLLGNALKYSPNGGAVTVRLVPSPTQVALEVTDVGLGIPAEALSTLFERFSRVRGTEAERLGGLGLGLYVVNQIVRGHGGLVEVESKPDEGSTFRVRLPRAVSAQAGISPTKETAKLVGEMLNSS